MSQPIDRTALIKKIQHLEGLTREEKSSLVELLHQKKYGLVWEEKTENVEERMREQLPFLEEVKERAIKSETPDAPNHVLIEGDNLEALTVLSYTHEGKIDVIYIDPPYNTGNKDFIYNDSYVDTEDSYRHSKWLSFMSKRLKIAKRLLSEKGVIFISIDDNEQAQLKLLCDEVLGNNNFIGNVIWEKTDSPRMDVKGFTVRHDFILVYAKKDFILKRIKPQNIPEHYNKIDDKGRKYYLKPLRLMGGHKSDSLYYGIEAPDGSIIYPKETNGDNGCWRWSKEKYNDEIERIEWIKGKKGWSANFRIYADNLTPTPVSTIWTFDMVGSTRTAKTELSSVIQQFIFSYPKPSTLISFIFRIASDKSSLILDFFAGSGTTLHATMQLNSEDGGHRQCILVTNNENGICEQVTYERNKRVICGYTTPKGQYVEGLSGNSLRYYRTALLPRSRTLRNMRALVSAATDMLCIKEDLYEERGIFGNLVLQKELVRYFCDGRKHMLVVYEETLASQLSLAISKMDLGGSRVKIYIFSPERYAFDDEFWEVEDKVQLIALPAAIYDAYKKVLPRRAEQPLDPPKEVKKIPNSLFDTAEEENIN
ncbi:MAG: site-specific DNA-methyltransferase [Prevotella sp.]|nr:site-specific DNA-methyltransferase [Prevotella sp.]